MSNILMQVNCKEDMDNLYASNDINDIIRFYYCFDEVEELIKWSRSRPSADINVIEIGGNSDIVFIIPTPDVKDKLTLSLLDSIKNFHTILVESKGKYFNYAKSVNKGVSIALKYNPKWIIVSNNDIVIEDNIRKLYSELIEIDNKKVSALIGAGGSDSFNLCKFTFLSNILIFTKYKEKLNILKKFYSKFFIYNYSKFFNMLCNPIVLVRNLSFFGQFLIVSPHYMMGKGGRLFDETYINGVEDVDVLLDVLSNGYYRPIHFKIKHLIGASLGRDEKRVWRNYFNIVYLNYKINRNFIKIDKTNIIL